MKTVKLIRYIKFLNAIPILLGNASTVTYINCDKAEHRGFLIVYDRENREVIVRDRAGEKWHVPVEGIAVMKFTTEDAEVETFIEEAAKRLLTAKYTVGEMMNRHVPAPAPKYVDPAGSVPTPKDLGTPISKKKRKPVGLGVQEL